MLSLKYAQKCHTALKNKGMKLLKGEMKSHFGKKMMIELEGNCRYNPDFVV